MKFSRLFLPHPQTHEKAYLLSFKAFAVYFLLFFLIEFVVRGGGLFQTGVLGISASLTQGQIIELTNQERAKSGLAPLTEDARLTSAASAKAQNMFAENYWAHYSPSGKDPWGFIQGAGYQFSYAGENLAKNFSSSPEVVAAWMASPTHRENIVNKNYTNIGIAIAEGKINGVDTVVVVQEFGKPQQTMLAKLPEKAAPQSSSTPAKEVPVETASAAHQPTPEPTVFKQPQPAVIVAGSEIPPVLQVAGVNISKTFGLSIIGLLIVLIAIDLYVLRRRMVHRLSSKHLSHLAMLSVAGSVLLNSSVGQITQQAAAIFLGK